MKGKEQVVALVVKYLTDHEDSVYIDLVRRCEKYCFRIPHQAPTKASEGMFEQSFKTDNIQISVLIYCKKYEGKSPEEISALALAGEFDYFLNKIKQMLLDCMKTDIVHEGPETLQYREEVLKQTYNDSFKNTNNSIQDYQFDKGLNHNNKEQEDYHISPWHSEIVLAETNGFEFPSYYESEEVITHPQKWKTDRATMSPFQKSSLHFQELEKNTK